MNAILSYGLSVIIGLAFGWYIAGGRPGDDLAKLIISMRRKRHISDADLFAPR